MKMKSPTSHTHTHTFLNRVESPGFSTGCENQTIGRLSKHFVLCRVKYSISKSTAVGLTPNLPHPLPRLHRSRCCCHFLFSSSCASWTSSFALQTSLFTSSHILDTDSPSRNIALRRAWVSVFVCALVCRKVFAKDCSDDGWRNTLAVVVLVDFFGSRRAERRLAKGRKQLCSGWRETQVSRTAVVRMYATSGASPPGLCGVL